MSANYLEGTFEALERAKANNDKLIMCHYILMIIQSGEELSSEQKVRLVDNIETLAKLIIN